MDIQRVIEHNRDIQDQLFSQNKELQAIRDELREAAIIPLSQSKGPVIATGHQPTIYYPGLLFKDYFTGASANRTGATAVNFVVDSDKADFRVPVPSQEQDELKKIRVELKNRENKTYAEFNPSSEQINNFFDKISQTTEALSHPSIQEAFEHYKKQFFDAFEKKQNFTETVRHLRNLFDRELGFDIKDIKISHLAQSHGYYRYILYLLRNLERFTEAYNHAVKQYKRKDYQPVKFLDYQSGWYELPFWLCRDAKRHPVYVKKEEAGFHFFSEEADAHITVNTKDKNNDEEIITALKDALVMYPKATTLTLMIRLFLCDVFVHGTGAKEYEKVNNTILHEFFGLKSRPYFYGVTGDIWLPLIGHEGAHNGLEKEYKRKQHWLEEVDRDPEKHIPRVLAEQYKEEKKQLARQMQQEEDPGKRRELHQKLTKKDEEMKQYLKPEIEKVKKTLARYDKLLSKRDVYFERKYPYFLYPSEFLTHEIFKKNLITELKPD